MSNLPKKFSFNHARSDKQDGKIMQRRYVEFNYTGPDKFLFRVKGLTSLTYFAVKAGDKMVIRWNDDDGGVDYDLDDVQGFLDSGYWEQKEADILWEAPASDLDVLIDKAKAASYDIAFEPNGDIRLQGMQSGSRSVKLKSVKLALQWFGLMAQLKTVESGEG